MIRLIYTFNSKNFENLKKTASEILIFGIHNMCLHEYMKARLTFINMYSNRLHSVEKKLEAPYVF